MKKKNLFRLAAMVIIVLGTVAAVGCTKEDAENALSVLIRPAEPRIRVQLNNEVKKLIYVEVEVEDSDEKVWIDKNLNNNQDEDEVLKFEGISHRAMIEINPAELRNLQIGFIDIRGKVSSLNIISENNQFIKEIDITRSKGLSRLTADGTEKVFHPDFKKLDLSQTETLKQCILGGGFLEEIVLDAEKNKMLHYIICEDNNLNEKAEAFVTNLPKRDTQRGYLSFKSSVNTERNKLTKAQATIAIEKGWDLFQINSSGATISYTGE